MWTKIKQSINQFFCAHMFGRITAKDWKCNCIRCGKININPVIRKL